MDISNQPDREVQFKPLSEGLGFHPFSDGLPYATTRKPPHTPSRTQNPPQNLTTGSGAVAAGPPVYSPVLPPIATSKLAPQEAPAVVPQIQLETQWKPGMGYLVQRALAFGLDFFVCAAFCAAGSAVLVYFQAVDVSLFLNRDFQWIGAVLLCILVWVCTGIQDVLLSTSIGKRVFGFSLEGGVLSRFLRMFLIPASFGVFGIGLLWSLIDPRKRCLHDILSGAQPVRFRSTR